MRKNKNNVYIEGYVYDIKSTHPSRALAKKITGSTSKNPGTPFIGGEMAIAVDEEGLEIVKVSFTYVTEYSKKGDKNRTFGILEDIIDNDKTWLSKGKEAAPKVSITGSLALNEYYNKENGELVSNKVINGSFVNNVSTFKRKEGSRVAIEADMFITNVKRIEADGEKVLEDYMNVKGFVFNFRNEILPYTFILHNPKGMDYLEGEELSNKNPLYTKIFGTIKSISTKKENVTETKWGEPIVEVFENKRDEWQLINMANVPYEYGEPDVLTPDDMNEANKAREIHLAEVKKNQEEWASKAAAKKEESGPSSVLSDMTNDDNYGGF